VQEGNRKPHPVAWENFVLAQEGGSAEHPECLSVEYTLGQTDSWSILQNSNIPEYQMNYNVRLYQRQIIKQKANMEKWWNSNVNEMIGTN